MKYRAPERSGSLRRVAPGLQKKAASSGFISSSAATQLAASIMAASAAIPLMSLASFAQRQQWPNKVVPVLLQLKQGPPEADPAALAENPRSAPSRKLKSAFLNFSLRSSGVGAAPGPPEQRPQGSPNRPVPVSLQKMHFGAPDEAAGGRQKKLPPLQDPHGPQPSLPVPLQAMHLAGGGPGSGASG